MNRMNAATTQVASQEVSYCIFAQAKLEGVAGCYERPRNLPAQQTAAAYSIPGYQNPNNLTLGTPAGTISIYTDRPVGLQYESSCTVKELNCGYDLLRARREPFGPERQDHRHFWIWQPGACPGAELA